MADGSPIPALAMKICSRLRAEHAAAVEAAASLSGHPPGLADAVLADAHLGLASLDQAAHQSVSARSTASGTAARGLT
jgi:hypothetical protein